MNINSDQQFPPPPASPPLNASPTIYLVDEEQHKAHSLKGDYNNFWNSFARLVHCLQNNAKLGFRREGKAIVEAYFHPSVAERVWELLEKLGYHLDDDFITWAEESKSETEMIKVEDELNQPF